MRLSATVVIAAWCAWAATAAAAPPGAGQVPGPAPEPARQAYRPVEFGRLVAELPTGERWLEVGQGLLCTPLRSRAVDGGRKELDVPSASTTFREELGRAGLVAAADDDLFGPSSSNPPDFVLSGVVVALHEKVCAPGVWAPGKVKGAIEMTVEWRLYARSRKQVVATVRTSADQSIDPEPAGAHVLLSKAFAEAVRKMAADPAIRRALAVDPAVVQQAYLPTPKTPILLAGSLTAAPHGVSVAADSVVLISPSANSFGSGFLVSTDGYLLTDAHVVGEAKTVKVRWSDGVEADGVVVRLAAGRDVALIKTDPRGHAPLPLRKDAPLRGDAIFAIGAPLYQQFQGTVMRGVISASRVIRGYDMLQSDANVNHGMSGGPVLDEQGRVIALVESVVQLQTNVPEGINYFTPIGDALRYLSLTPQ